MGSALNQHSKVERLIRRPSGRPLKVDLQAPQHRERACCLHRRLLSFAGADSSTPVEDRRWQPTHKAIVGSRAKHAQLTVRPTCQLAGEPPA